ncbi:gluconokinase, partial [Alphaproteobacteria bacterium]|nr:gluconokinase [Alphaproteobacteria bacterium]
LVYLKISKELATTRINSRSNHFMPGSLVDSQFLILEEPKDAIIFNQDLTEKQTVDRIIKELEIEI